MVYPDSDLDNAHKRRDPVDLTREQTSVSLEAIPDEGHHALRAEAPPQETGGTTIQSVLRALDIIEILASSNHPMRLQDIAEKSQLNSSTCHHLLNSLVTRNFAARLQNPRTYILGPRVGQLAQQNRHHFDLAQIAQPHLATLSQKTGASACLASLQNTRLSLVGECPSPNGPDTENWRTDLSRAAHATAVGKAILAWLPEMQIARVVAANDLTPFTESTIRTLAELVENLRLIRRHGFAVEDREFQAGISGVAVALRDKSGGVVGAIGCLIHETEATNERLIAIQSDVRTTAQALAPAIP